MPNHERQHFPDGWFKVCRKTTLERARDVGATAWLVYTILCAHANGTTGIAYPSLTTIAAEAGVHRRTVINAIKRLEHDGLIQVIREKHQGSGGWSVNRYRIMGSESLCTTVVNPGSPDGDSPCTTVVNDDAPKQENKGKRECRAPDGAHTSGHSLNGRDPESGPQAEPSPPISTPARPRGEVAQAIWGAIADYLGYEPPTESEAGKWRKGIKQLQDAGVTDIEIPELIHSYVDILKYPSLNPMSLANNLSPVRAALPDMTPRTKDEIECIIEYKVKPNHSLYTEELERLAKRAGRSVEEQELYHGYLIGTHPEIRDAYRQRVENGEIADVEMPLETDVPTWEEYLANYRDIRARQEREKIVSKIEHDVLFGRREIPEGFTLDQYLDEIKKGIQQP